MEETIVIVCVIIITITFIVKTISELISDAQSKKCFEIRRAENEAERKSRRETRFEERIRQLEKLADE